MKQTNDDDFKLWFYVQTMSQTVPGCVCVTVRSKIECTVSLYSTVNVSCLFQAVSLNRAGVKRLDGRVNILKGGVNKATGRSRLVI